MITTNAVSTRGYIDHADRLITDTYPLSRDPKLFIPALRLIARSLEDIGGSDALSSIRDTIAAYDDRVIEFVREDLLVFANDAMRTNTVSLTQVHSLIEEAKRAYEEGYR